MSYMRLLLILIFSTAMCSCEEDGAVVDFSQDELIRLLTGDSVKSWILTSRNQELMNCEQDDRFIFQIPDTTNDSLSFNFESGPVLCPGQLDSIILKGTWNVSSRVGPDTLFLMLPDDTLFRIIQQISSEIMVIQYRDNGELVEEQFLSIL